MVPCQREQRMFDTKWDKLPMFWRDPADTEPSQPVAHSSIHTYATATVAATDDSGQTDRNSSKSNWIQSSTVTRLHIPKFLYDVHWGSPDSDVSFSIFLQHFFFVLDLKACHSKSQYQPLRYDLMQLGHKLWLSFSCDTFYGRIFKIDELVQKRRNSSALAMELRLSCISSSKCYMVLSEAGCSMKDVTRKGILLMSYISAGVTSDDKRPLLWQSVLVLAYYAIMRHWSHHVFAMPVATYAIPVASFTISVASYAIPVASYAILVATFTILVASYAIPVASYTISVASYAILVASFAIHVATLTITVATYAIIAVTRAILCHAMPYPDTDCYN